MEKFDSFSRINLKEAIQYISNAWHNVREVTISNCFRHSNILGAIKNAELQQLQDKLNIIDLHDEENELSNLIQQLSLNNSMEVEEYLCNKDEEGKNCFIIIFFVKLKKLTKFFELLKIFFF